MPVSVVPGCYVVTRITRSGHQRMVTSVHFVGKDRVCTCGGNKEKPCGHIREVESYLRSGGQRAPDAPRQESNKSSRGGAACPVCGAPIRLGGADWRCEQGGFSHYWQWRLEGNERIKAFFTDPNHPAKRGNAFYTMTPEEREVWLKSHSFPADYTPYA